MKNLKKAIILFILAICFTAIIPNTIYNNSINQVEAASTKLNSKKITLYKGQVYNLSLKNSVNKVIWSSKNKSVATVNKSGKVTAKKNGTTTIIAKLGDKTYKCKVTVKTLNLYKTNAKTIVNAIMKCDLNIEGVVTYNKKTDANKLLGKYGQYKSKTDFYDSRYFEKDSDKKSDEESEEESEVDSDYYCTIEVFENDDFAIDRYNYLDSIYKAVPSWRMRMYRIDNVVLRLTSSMSKSESNQYSKAIKKMSGN